MSDAANRFDHLNLSLLAQPKASHLTLVDGLGSYSVAPQNAAVAAKLQPSYTRAELRAFFDWLDQRGVTRLELTQSGLIRAAERVAEDARDPIHYDSVWVRDAAWGALGLLATPGRGADAGRVMHELLRSFATPLQLGRFDAVIADPGLVAPSHPEAGMNAVHIRFDGRSPTYSDVMRNGEPHGWNHKQNDALGLFLIVLVQLCSEGLMDVAHFKRNEWAALSRFAPYFEAIDYDTQEDAGAWEEIERLNSSSVGLVAHALDLLAQGFAALGSGVVDVASSDRPLESSLFAAWARHLASEPEPIAQAHQVGRLEAANARGVAVVRRQLPSGESPGYPTTSPKWRGPDAALLNLIVPAPLRGLSLSERRLAVNHVASLVRPLGVLRYVGDSYQSANTWFQDPVDANSARNEGTTASGQAFLERATGFVVGTEAQWFFDSWLSWAFAELFKVGRDPTDLQASYRHLNRALAQITPDPAPLGADGRPGQSFALPESYNTVITTTGIGYMVPSPVMPLNWAKASLALAFAALGDCLPV